MNRTLTDRITIRVRLILWYVFCLAATVLGYSAYIQLQFQSSLYDQVDTSLHIAVAQLLVDVDDTVNPPALRPMSPSAVDNLNQSRFALRIVTQAGEVTAQVGQFPAVTGRPLEGYQTIASGDGKHWRLYTQRIVTNAGAFDVFLQSAQSLTIIDTAQSSLAQITLIAIPIVLLAAALVGTFIANRSLSPLNVMTRAAQQINATDMTQRIGYDGPADELGRLAVTLNSMLERLETAFEHERRFTADASHELRTPLTAIKGQIGVTLSRDRTHEEYRSALVHIQHETDRLIRLINDLLFLARLDTAASSRHNESLGLSDLLAAVIDQLTPMAHEKRLHIRSVVPEDLAVVGIPDHLIRLFLNLLDNAIKFTPPNGVITLSSQQTPTEVRVAIADTGQGIAQEHLVKIFQRFYRAEADRSARSGGTGLGLAIAYQIAREHHGSIDVESLVGCGSTFTVCLPLAPAQPAPAAHR